MKKLLEIKNLSIAFQTENGLTKAVNQVSLHLHEGETLALVGESGSGKTVLCKSMLKLLCKRATITSGETIFQGKSLISISEREMEEIRGSDIAMVFQDPMTSLNPTLSIGKQIMEVLLLHGNMNKEEAKKTTLELLEMVGLRDSEKRFQQYPHHFSGGMRQRVAIAIALAGKPKVLLADEPTTSLDLDTQQQIISLLKEIQKKINISIIFITHDLGLVEDLADRVAVMYQGEIVEEGIVSEVFQCPKHEYTKKLLGYLNYTKGKGHTHGKIHFHDGKVHAHAHEEEHSHTHQHQRVKEDHDSFISPKDQKTLLSIEHLKMYFTLDKHTLTKAVDDISFSIFQGEILGIIGPSGCGKSTLARCIMGIYKPTAGEIKYYGKNKQIIFQDSMSAFNPRMTIGEIIEEPMKIKKMYQSKQERRKRVYELMELVELDHELAGRYPYDVSGGQRQRAAIARAISVNPDFIVADEPIASLDISIQAQIVHLFKRLQEQLGLTILFIAHDVPMVRHISDRMIVMEKGKVK